MRILIVSDTHRMHRNLEDVLEKVGEIDEMIHLGDVEGGDDYINAFVDCPVHFVAGNNDFWSGLPQEDHLFIRGHHIFITHGHYYHVSRGYEKLATAAREKNADIVMYGHTHRPLHVEEDGLLILNPGSISLPRQEGRRPSYMIMEIDEQGKVDVKIQYM